MIVETEHYIFKTHRGHKILMGLISLIVLVIGILLGKNAPLFSVNENDFRSFTVTLLFILNLIIIVLILIMAEFLIELKDSMAEAEKEVLKKEQDIRKALKKLK